MGMYTATSGTDSWMKVFGIDTEHIDQWEIVRRSEFMLAQNPKGIVLDLRYNGGGNPIGLAGFLTDQEIPMPQGYSYNPDSGEFEADGDPGRILPNEEQFSFDKVVVLVGPACASACEDEAYSFSQVPNVTVVGMFPTSGTMADVGDGQISMPDGIFMQFPTERFLLEDGSLFLQGTGVQPDLWVPKTFETVTSTEDVVLQFGENAVLLPLGAGITPSGSPTLVDVAEAENYLASADFLQDIARESYTEEILEPHTLTYTVPVSQSAKNIWAYYWCAASADTLTANWDAMTFKFVMNGEEVAADKLATYDWESSGYSCRMLYVPLINWPAGEHHLSITTTFTETINDGASDYAAGDYISEFTVYVKP